MAHLNSTAQLLRVDHAGERGAICIYRGQIAVARLLHKPLVDPLEEMLSHELRHFSTFDAILKHRDIRSCHALALWALGGWVIGITTALMGERAVWVCTAAIENTVNEHLEHQVDFLGQADLEVFAAVQSIRRDEEAHENHALEHGGHGGGLYAILRWTIRGATSLAIWLSTKL